MWELSDHPVLVLKPNFHLSDGAKLQWAITSSGDWKDVRLYNDTDNYRGLRETVAPDSDIIHATYVEGDNITAAGQTVFAAVLQTVAGKSNGKCKCKGPAEIYSYDPPVLMLSLPHPVLRTGGAAVVLDYPAIGDDGPITDGYSAPTSLHIHLAMGRSLRNVQFASLVPSPSHDDPTAWDESIDPNTDDSLRVTGIGIDLNQQTNSQRDNFLAGLLLGFAVSLIPLLGKAIYDVPIIRRALRSDADDVKGSGGPTSASDSLARPDGPRNRNGR
jgi:hypothetical protein